MVLLVGLQVPWAVVDKVRFTLPAAISAAEGVYVGFSIAVLEKDPVPLVDHKVVGATADATTIVPERVTTALLPQTV
jgi:hypothetical protein